MRQVLTVLVFALGLGLFAAGCDSGPTAPGTQSASVPDASEKSARAPTQGPTMSPENFVAPLSGNEVVPSSVDTEARGLAKLMLNAATDQLQFRLNVANIEDIIGAHIHAGGPDENGPIVVPLFGNPFVEEPVSVNGTLVEGTATVADLSGPNWDEFEEMMRSGNTYVQIHTVDNPGGEIRGQLDRGNGVAR